MESVYSIAEMTSQKTPNFNTASPIAISPHRFKWCAETMNTFKMQAFCVNIQGMCIIQTETTSFLLDKN